MRAELISWVFARDLNQWIPAGEEDIEVSLSRRGNYVWSNRWVRKVFDKKTLRLVSDTPRKSYPEYRQHRWPSLRLTP